MRQEADQTRDVEPLLAFRHGAADDDVLDLLGIDLGCATSAAITCAASSSGRTLASAPFLAKWKGERA